VIEGGITHGVLAMDSFVFGSSSREGHADDSIDTGGMPLPASINA
jgi:hypothetical protein